jgi:hypothetical protein
MVFGFMVYLTNPQPRYDFFGWLGYWLYLGGGVVFLLAFLLAGSASVPRRYAVHLAPWLHEASVGRCRLRIRAGGQINVHSPPRMLAISAMVEAVTAGGGPSSSGARPNACLTPSAAPSPP